MDSEARAPIGESTWHPPYDNGGHVSCKANPDDVWLRPMAKLNRDTYWEYALCYVDDILIISHKPQEAMDYLSSKYKVKEGSVKEPDSYLGAPLLMLSVTNYCSKLMNDLELR